MYVCQCLCHTYIRRPFARSRWPVHLILICVSFEIRTNPLRIPGNPLLTAYVSIRQHTSAYVSIRQHTPANVTRKPPPDSIRQHTSAYVSIRQHTPANVTRKPPPDSIRQHTSAYVSIRQQTSPGNPLLTHVYIEREV
jgi:hypothetical protein